MLPTIASALFAAWVASSYAVAANSADALFTFSHYFTFMELVLTLKKEWFDLIKSGEKKIEYREIKPYWVRRLVGNWQDYQDEVPFFRGTYILPFGVNRIRFKNGYSKNAPQIVVEWRDLAIDFPIAGLCPKNTDLTQKVFCLLLGNIISFD